MSGAFQVNTAAQAQRTLRNVQETKDDLSERQERLTTGKRINSASDDPAGFDIAKSTEATVGSQKKATRNIADAKNMLSIAEGGLSSQLDMLQTMKEKAVQAANGALSDDEREAIQSELNQLTREIQDVAENTKFKGKSLLDGKNKVDSTKTFSLQTGASFKDQLDVGIDSSETGEGGLGIGKFSGPRLVKPEGRVAVANRFATPDQFGAENVRVNPKDFGKVNNGSSTRVGREEDGLTTFFTDGERDPLSDSVVDAEGDPTETTGPPSQQVLPTASDNNVLVTTDEKLVSASAEDLKGAGGTLKNLDGGTYDLTVERTRLDTFEVSVDGGPTSTIKTGIRDPKPDESDIPEASFTTNPSNPQVGETVTFDASGSSDDNRVEEYQWDFDGDGDAEKTTTDPTVTKSFSTFGDKEVALIVEDESGLKDFTTETVNVAGSNPPDTKNDVSAPDDPESGPNPDLDHLEEPHEPREVVGGNGNRGINLSETDVLLEKDSESGDALKLDLRKTEKSVLTDVTGGTGGTGEFSVTVDKQPVELETQSASKIEFKYDLTRDGGPESAIDQIDSAIDKITSQIGDLGATQNRLSFKKENLETTQTTIEESQSRIEDADFARAQAEVAKLQVKQEAGLAQLVQANADLGSILSLLGG